MPIWKSAYMIVFIWKQFQILNLKNSRVIDTWSFFYFLKIRRLFLPFCCHCCWLWTYFSPLSGVSIVSYENVKNPLDFVFCFRAIEVFITKGGLQTLPHFKSEALLWTVPQCRCSRKTDKLLEKYLWMSSYLSKVSVFQKLDSFPSIFQGFL